MKQNVFLKAILIATIMNVLVACSAFQPESAAPMSPLRVEYRFWWGDYTLLVAQEKGFFEKYGVSVEPVYYDAFSDSFADLAAGQIDAALIAVGDSMSIARHTPVKVIGVSDDGSYMPIVARPEISTISDLRGKTIGILVGSNYELMILEMLKSANMDASDVTIININTEDVPAALQANTIQAGFTWEPFTSRAVNDGNHILYPVDNTLRLFPDTITFRQIVIDQRPEEIHGFMQAWFEAVNYRLANPQETREIAAKYIGVPVEQIEEDSFLKVLTYNDNISMFNPDASNENSISGIAAKTSEFLISVGTLASVPDLNVMIDPQYFVRQ